MKTHELKFYCSNCEQPLKCGVEFAGRQIECPECHEVVRIPDLPSTPGDQEFEAKSAHDWDTRNWAG